VGATLSDKDNIFIDANIFIYYVGDHPIFADTCEKLLLDVETNRSVGVTSIFVLNEVFHKMMMLEPIFRRCYTRKNSFLDNFTSYYFT